MRPSERVAFRVTVEDAAQLRQQRQNRTPCKRPSAPGKRCGRRVRDPCYGPYCGRSGAAAHPRRLIPVLGRRQRGGALRACVACGVVVAPGARRSGVWTSLSPSGTPRPCARGRERRARTTAHPPDRSPTRWTWRCRWREGSKTRLLARSAVSGLDDTREPRAAGHAQALPSLQTASESQILYNVSDCAVRGSLKAAAGATHAHAHAHASASSARWRAIGGARRPRRTQRDYVRRMPRRKVHSVRHVRGAGAGVCMIALSVVEPTRVSARTRFAHAAMQRRAMYRPKHGSVRPSIDATIGPWSCSWQAWTQQLMSCFIRQRAAR